MRAAVLHAPSDLRVEEVPDPVPAEDEVIVRVDACGICGSDLPRVLSKGTYHFPTIPGHEMAGTVVEVGPAVSGDLLGVPVAVVPLIPCRVCKMCSVGEFAMCADYDFLGSRSDGGFAEFARVPARNLVRLPESMTTIAGAMLEPATVALHAFRNSQVSFGSTVAVYGLGPVGNLLAQWAVCFGAERVIGIEIDPWRSQLAADMGVEVVSPQDGPVASQLRELVGGATVDFAFDASGYAGALPELMEAMAPMGTIGLVGRPAKEIHLQPSYFERQLRQQIRVQGNWSFQFHEYPQHAWRTTAHAVASGELSLLPLVTHRVPLEDLFKTISSMAAGNSGVMKALVEPGL